MLARILIPLASVIALFLFPWPVVLLFMLAASLLVTPAGFALGVLYDLIYFTPGSAFLPFMSLWGLALSVLAFLVHRFVKTRSITE